MSRNVTKKSDENINTDRRKLAFGAALLGGATLLPVSASARQVKFLWYPKEHAASMVERYGPEGAKKAAINSMQSVITGRVRSYDGVVKLFDGNEEFAKAIFEEGNWDTDKPVPIGFWALVVAIAYIIIAIDKLCCG